MVDVILPGTGMVMSYHQTLVGRCHTARYWHGDIIPPGTDRVMSYCQTLIGRRHTTGYWYGDVIPPGIGRLKNAERRTQYAVDQSRVQTHGRQCLTRLSCTQTRQSRCKLKQKTIHDCQVSVLYSLPNYYKL